MSSSFVVPTPANPRGTVRSSPQASVGCSSCPQLAAPARPRYASASLSLASSRSFAVQPLRSAPVLRPSAILNKQICMAKQRAPRRERSMEELEAAVKEPIPAWAKNVTLAVPSVLLIGAILVSAAGEAGEAFLQDSHVRMLAINLAFATGHSGLAALRPRGEAWMGARAYRVLFALFSLPMAGALITYFLVHRYDGVQLWQVQGVPGVRELVWLLSAVSFIFLYPATFNLAEVAAINKPQVRLYEEGIIRITRHPQMVGQGIWCVAHTLWIGTTFALVTSFGLMAHHIFAVWHGDKRLRERFGPAFDELAARTSVLPFQAIAEGRNKLVLREFVRPAYLGTAAFVLAFYALHPAMFDLAARLHG